MRAERPFISHERIELRGWHKREDRNEATAHWDPSFQRHRRGW